MMSKALRRRALKPALAATIATIVLAAATTASAVTVVSFSFDDGLSSAPMAGSIMSAFGLKASFFIITGKVGQTGFLTWGDVKTLAAEGHEIGAHTVQHRDLALLTPEEQKQEICGSREALEAEGYHPLSFAYPNGAFNAASLLVLQECGFTSARLFGDYQGPNGPGPSEDTKIYPEPYSIPNPFELSTQGSPETPVTLQELKNDYTMGVGGWVIIAVHGICPSVEKPNESECAGLYGPTSQTILEEYLQWIGERPETLVRTIGQVVNDTVLPTTTITCDGIACAGPYRTPVTVALSADDANLTVTQTRYTTDGSEPTTSSPTYTAPFQVTSTATVKYRSWDIRGKAEPTRSQTITIDTTPPVTIIESGPPANSESSGASIAFRADEPATFECSLDEDVFVPCSSPYTVMGLGVGRHDLRIYATDIAGNVESPPVSYSWTVDAPFVSQIDGGSSTEALPAVPPHLVLDRRAGADALRDGLPVGLYCPGSCSATIVVRAPVAVTSAGRRRVHDSAIASVHSSTPRAGTLNLHVKLTSKRGALIGGGPLRTVPLAVVVTLRTGTGAFYELHGSVSLRARLGHLHWV